jgi:hypothetical protein
MSVNGGMAPQVIKLKIVIGNPYKMTNLKDKISSGEERKRFGFWMLID